MRKILYRTVPCKAALMTKRTAFAVRFVLTFPIFDAIIFFRKLSSTAAVDFPLSEGGLFLPQ